MSFSFIKGDNMSLWNINESKRNIKKLKVVYSKELPKKTIEIKQKNDKKARNRVFLILVKQKS